MASPNDAKDMLKSTDPRTRMRGVKLVAQMKNNKALRILAYVIENDTDPEVRELAQKATTYIIRKLESQETTAAPAPLTDDGRPLVQEPISTFGKEMPGTPKSQAIVPERDKKRARGYMEQVLSIADPEKAINSLEKALKLDPSLADDDYFRSMAMSVTDLPQDEAIELLQDSSAKSNMTEQLRRERAEQGVSNHMQEVNKHTWTTIGIDITFLAIIVLAGTVLSLLVLQQGAANDVANANPIVQEIAQTILLLDDEIDITRPVVVDTDGDGIDEDYTSAVIRYIFAIGITETITGSTIIGVSLYSMVTVVLSALILSVIVHITASAVLSGTGSIPYTIFNVTTLYTARFPIIFAAIIIAASIAFFAAGPFLVLSMLAMLVYILVTLLIVFQLTGRISRAYNFGFGSGCLTLIVAGVIIIIINSVLASLFSGLLGGIFELFTQAA